MVAGVDFEVPDYGEFEVLAISVHGNIKAIAKKLSVTPVTIYRHFKKDPELKCIVDEAREYNSFFDLDLAEHVNRYNMTNFINEPAIAQRAAEYTLDRKGRTRGWIKKEDDKENVSSDTLEKFTNLMDLISDSQESVSNESTLNMADSKIISADKSKLDTGDDNA